MAVVYRAIADGGVTHNQQIAITQAPAALLSPTAIMRCSA